MAPAGSGRWFGLGRELLRPRPYELSWAKDRHPGLAGQVQLTRQPAMIFTTVEFFVFFMLVLLGLALLRSFRAEKRFLLVASYVFYMSWNVLCGGLLFFTSALDYYVGRGLGVIEK